MDRNIQRLINKATEARARAYAPYSKFQVGAAILGKSGKIFTGCNVENVSYGLTICAERVCVVTAIAAEERKFEALAIVAGSYELIVPCGACRQVLAEFNPRLPIYSVTSRKLVREFRLDNLFPLPRLGILKHSRNV